jgi:1,2-dihydroxy-3-keto-5-methylthiopentene dioxygenase
VTLLTVWAEDNPTEPEARTEDADEIAALLKEIDVRFERWDVVDLGDDTTQDDVLAAYRDRIAEVTTREGYTLVDVAQLRPSDDPGWPEKAAAARAKFLDEHTHDDDEDRFFARGSGVFYLHLRGRVYGVLCEAGDLLSVPANTTHWFDMGVNPDFVAVRFFHDDDGWVGDFTGSGISAGFPGHDELVASRA